MAKPKEKPKKNPKKGKESKGGIIQMISSYFEKKDPRTPVKGCGTRIKNLFTMHYRGVIGMLIPLCFLTWQGEKGVHWKTVKCMWIWMGWFFFMRPVTPPVTATIPIFLLPMAGVMSTVKTCQCYMNENIMLFILTGMLALLLNNSGVDRRIALSIICSGDPCQFAGKRKGKKSCVQSSCQVMIIALVYLTTMVEFLDVANTLSTLERLVFKCSTAAFFLSMFSNRLIVSSTITQYVTKPLMDLQSATSKSRDSEPDYITIRNILNNAIQTSSAIGSIAIMHASYSVICFRAMWCQSPPVGKEFPDIFNYLQYSIYAFPVSFLMFILNFSYHMLLINWCTDKPMSSSSMGELRKALLKHKSTVPPKVTTHERLTVLAVIVMLLLFFLRWNKYMAMGWADFTAEPTSPNIPGLKDASAAAIMVLALHILPKGFGFLKYLSADKKSDLPPMKPESAILWWKFVDKNTNYGYIFMLGSGVTLVVAIRDTGLGAIVAENFGHTVSDHSWTVSVFLVCFFALILPNLMTNVATCITLLPFILNLGINKPAKLIGGEEFLDEPVFRSGTTDWALHGYIGALGVGLGSVLGFMQPFPYTPAFFCHATGKVPKRKMAKYSIGSSIICLVILWASLILYAPFLWDPSGIGIIPEKAPGAPVGNKTL